MCSAPHIIVGMSGGVDSTVTALCLKQAGYIVTALFMKNWEEDDTSTFCHSQKDLKIVRSVCKKLNISLLTVNFSTEYWQYVFQEFLDEYSVGRTPNPDILCNKEIKFKCFLDYAIKQGADYIATGHYAQTHPLSGRPQETYPLLKSLDYNKDQTYFLYTLNQNQLSKTLFPLGKLSKKKVRQIAKQAGFINHNKKDSTGICFIGERKFKSFLEDFLPAQPGEIRNISGECIGRHDGLMFYTLGQRQGLKIGGKKHANSEPWYVVGKSLSSNTLIVTQGQQHPWHYSTELKANKLHWVQGPPNKKQFQCTTKIRYRQEETPCHVTLSNDTLVAQFSSAQRAVTPGQSIVFYDNNICLGGGIIVSTNSPGGLLN